MKECQSFFERDLRAQGALSRGIVGLGDNCGLGGQLWAWETIVGLGDKPFRRMCTAALGFFLPGVSIGSHPSALVVHPNQLHCVAAHIERVLLCTVAAPNIEP
jgi:hypothetical protein